MSVMGKKLLEGLSRVKSFVAQNPAPSMWAAQNIPGVRGVQNKLQQAELARINYQRESQNGIVGNRLLQRPYLAIPAATVQQVAQSAPQIARSMARLTPPALNFNSYMAAQQRNPQFVGQTANDLYNTMKGIGYTNPLGTAVGGAVGVGVQGVMNKFQGKPFINKNTYAEDFARSADQMAAVNAISAANPIFRSRLAQPIMKFGGMQSKLQKVANSTPVQMAGRGVLRVIREGTEGAVGGAIRPLNKDENRLQAVGTDALTGALMGVALQFGTDFGNVKLKPILNKIGVGLKDYAEFVQDGLGKGRFVKTKNGNLRARGYTPTGEFNRPMEQLGSRVSVKPPTVGGEGGEGGKKVKISANPVAQEAMQPQTPQTQGLLPSQNQRSGENQIMPLSRGTLGTMEQPGKMQANTQELQGRTEGTIQPQSTQSNQSGSSTTSIPHANKWSFGVFDKLYQEYVNRFHGMEKLAGQAGQGKKLQGDLAQFYGSASTAQYHLENELSPILKEQNVDDLRQAAVALRDIELSSREIKGSPAQKQAQANLEALQARLGPEKMTQLGATLKKLYAYQDEMVRRYLVDTGIMSQSSYDAMRKNNQFYVPFKRVMDQVDEMLGIPVNRGAGSVGKQNVVYGIKGSDKNIVDPVESIIENTYKLVSLGRRQQVAQTISGLSKELPDIVKRVGSGDQRNTITLFENGKKVYYQVPEEVAEAARGLGQESLITLVKILKLPTDMFRTMTTGVNPEFFFPNVSRDLQSAWFNRGVNPLKWIAGLAHYAKKDNVYQDFLKAGGKTGMVSMNRPFLKTSAEELAGKGKVIKNPIDFLESWSMASEQPTRIASFQKAYGDAIKKGLSREDALREGAYWAQEGTVNFPRRGSKMSNINAIYAYLNARIQGVDRMFRSAKENPEGTGVRFAFGFLAPALGLYAWNNKFSEYNDERIVSKRDKQDNFIFMLPKEVNGVRFLKLPKSEIAKVVNPVETFLDYAQGKGGDIAQSFGNVLLSFSPIDNVGGLIPTAINPVIENAFNKDFYSGYDIVPDYKKNLPKGYQDSPYTSPLFRMIGQKTNQSPALLQNLGESYGGGLMRVAEMASQPFIPDQYKSKKNDQGAPINRTPILRRFMGGEKRTQEEQIKANESRAKAIEFDVNDIKGAVNRGDIPFEVGRKQIEKIRQQVPTGSGIKADATQQGRMVAFINSEGKYQEIDTSFQPTYPKLTGIADFDKIKISDYKSDINKKIKDISILLDQGIITREQALIELNKVKALKNAVSGSGKKKITDAQMEASYKRLLKALNPTQKTTKKASIIQSMPQVKLKKQTMKKLY